MVVFDKKKHNIFNVDVLVHRLAGWGKSSRMFHLEPIKYNMYPFKTRLSQFSASVPGILLVFKYSPKKKNQSDSEPVYRVHRRISVTSRWLCNTIIVDLERNFRSEHYQIK